MESTEQVNRDAAIPDPDEPVLSVEDRLSRLETRVNRLAAFVEHRDMQRAEKEREESGLDVKV